MSAHRCPFCHKLLAPSVYEEHVAQHRGTRADGQQNEYATLPVENRYHGSLDGVPMWYTHQKCGRTTGMPEYIVRTYLADPYFYGAGATYCCGCQTHVPHEECFWVETGENMLSYNDRLKSEHEARGRLQQQYQQASPASTSTPSAPDKVGFIQGLRDTWRILFSIDPPS